MLNFVLKQGVIDWVGDYNENKDNNNKYYSKIYCVQQYFA